MKSQMSLKTWISALASIFVFVACSSGPDIPEQSPQFQVPNPPLSNSNPPPFNSGNPDTSGQGDEDIEPIDDTEGSAEEEALDEGEDSAEAEGEGEETIEERLANIEDLLRGTNRAAQNASSNSSDAKNLSKWGFILSAAALAAIPAGFVIKDQIDRERSNKSRDEILKVQAKNHEEVSQRMGRLDRGNRASLAVGAVNAQSIQQTRDEVQALRDDLAGIESAVAAMQTTDLPSLAERVQEYSEKVDQFQQAMQGQIDENKGEMDRQFKGLVTRSNTLEEQLRSAQGRLDGIDTQIGKLEGSDQSRETAIANLKEKRKGLQKTVDKLKIDLGKAKGQLADIQNTQLRRMGYETSQFPPLLASDGGAANEAQVEQQEASDEEAERQASIAPSTNLFSLGPKNPLLQSSRQPTVADIMQAATERSQNDGIQERYIMVDIHGVPVPIPVSADFFETQQAGR